MAPHTPQRSSRPGEAGARLEAPAPTPPSVRLEGQWPPHRRGRRSRGAPRGRL